MNKNIRLRLSLLTAAVLLPLALTPTANARLASAEIGPNTSAPYALAQARTCSKRAGPYVTQSTAYQRRRQAIAQGYQVSGVFPNQGGYAFNYFWYC